MFDTSSIWAGVLKKLRENKEHLLLGACSDLDVAFTTDDIFVTTHNDTMHAILAKNLLTLNKYAGGEYISLRQTQKSAPNTNTEKLKEMFGDKLVFETK